MYPDHPSFLQLLQILTSSQIQFHPLTLSFKKMSKRIRNTQKTHMRMETKIYKQNVNYPKNTQIKQNESKKSTKILLSSFFVVYS